MPEAEKALDGSLDLSENATHPKHRNYRKRIIGCTENERQFPSIAVNLLISIAQADGAYVWAYASIHPTNNRLWLPSPHFINPSQTLMATFAPPLPLDDFNPFPRCANLLSSEHFVYKVNLYLQCLSLFSFSISTT